MCVLRLIDRFHLKLNNAVHILLFFKSILRIQFFFLNKINTHSLRKVNVLDILNAQIILTVFDDSCIIAFTRASFIPKCD